MTGNMRPHIYLGGAMNTPPRVSSGQKTAGNQNTSSPNNLLLPEQSLILALNIQAGTDSGGK
eukprot:4294843-Amphidinium_carterae.1